MMHVPPLPHACNFGCTADTVAARWEVRRGPESKSTSRTNASAACQEMTMEIEAEAPDERNMIFDRSCMSSKSEMHQSISAHFKTHRRTSETLINLGKIERPGRH